MDSHIIQGRKKQDAIFFGMKTKLVNWIKKYWWVVVVVILTAIAVWFLKPSPIIPPAPDNAVIIHQFDSVKYIKTADSLKVVISGLEKEIVSRRRSYEQLARKLNEKVNAVQSMPATDVVTAFNERTGDSSVIEQRDGNDFVISPMSAIRVAVVEFYQKDAAMAGIAFYSEQDSINQLIVKGLKDLVATKDSRIVKLTNEFYNQESEKAELKAQVEKEQKKVRRRNTVIGITAGAAAVAVIIAVVK
jgi:hypothetical protein